MAQAREDTKVDAEDVVQLLDEIFTLVHTNFKQRIVIDILSKQLEAGLRKRMRSLMDRAEKQFEARLAEEDGSQAVSLSDDDEEPRLPPMHVADGPCCKKCKGPVAEGKVYCADHSPTERKD